MRQGFKEIGRSVSGHSGRTADAGNFNPAVRARVSVLLTDAFAAACENITVILVRAGF